MGKDLDRLSSHSFRTAGATYMYHSGADALTIHLHTH
ncbi:hypothetical protein F441_10675 [Phytophthora nicotianae CJ01A1]|uniref:Tyr recombinase domain-containing protein n=5 Tax=Phytophthora nicotianae TaxID=4792 RepID=W2Q6L1_PHYN3|nr:hypothetical protein PPTG_23097 [Phytophthora nicotianae INRA-310]ETI44567.1 hypothetical protein F443_10740 [Phytophthora nicotianae P1569]ETO73207.1 hypothetical protein F444_10832 [Phytophthora nicotianae P1976]ETP14388.1 hypothetical protein F441_10675 [Phytophthora nicotianae CJ01A1]ETP42450.1 hypothetical protein F442_10641 [Phytophthora nicotianae P10297]ETN07890.1 hypothetical protein PPTG_23097 [Phytophthora nicotianae INRA-310]